MLVFSWFSSEAGLSSCLPSPIFLCPPWFLSGIGSDWNYWLNPSVLLPWCISAASQTPEQSLSTVHWFPLFGTKGDWKCRTSWGVITEDRGLDWQWTPFLSLAAATNPGERWHRASFFQGRAVHWVHCRHGSLDSEAPPPKFLQTCIVN